MIQDTIKELINLKDSTPIISNNELERIVEDIRPSFIGETIGEQIFEVLKVIEPKIETIDLSQSTITGQAVSSIAYILLGSNLRGPVNDVDIFVDQDFGELGNDTDYGWVTDVMPSSRLMKLIEHNVRNESAYSMDEPAYSMGMSG